VDFGTVYNNIFALGSVAVENLCTGFSFYLIYFTTITKQVITTVSNNAHWNKCSPFYDFETIYDIILSLDYVVVDNLLCTGFSF